MPKTNEFLLKQLIDTLLGYAAEHYFSNDMNLFKKFVEIFYSQAPYDDLKVRSKAELLEMASVSWKLLQHRKPDEINLELLTPPGSEGWSSQTTIVAVLCADAPFLVDTIRLELNKLDIPINLIVHTGGMVVERSHSGDLLGCDFFRRSDVHHSIEAPILFEIQQITDEVFLSSLRVRLLSVIRDVLLAVRDWEPMRERMESEIAIMTNPATEHRPSDSKESIAFLKWLLDNHFIFLGARDYVVLDEGDDMVLQLVSGSGLGVLFDESNSQVQRKFSQLPAKAAKLMHSSDRALMISKSNTLSSVHRAGYTDYIGIKQFDKDGALVGERRFIGLYTSAAYHSSPNQIPFLGKKVSAVLKRSGLRERSHAEKELISILSTLPRDDLIQASVGQLYHIAMGIMHMQERKQVRLFVREDNYGRFVSCLVYLPREKFTTSLLQEMQSILLEEFCGIESSFSTHFAVSVLARIDFVIRLNPVMSVKYQVRVIEQRLINAVKSWQDELYEVLYDSQLVSKRPGLIGKYKQAFPASYREKNTPQQAVDDIRYLESLSDDRPLAVELQVLNEGADTELSFKVFNIHNTIALSDALPVLEHMGCRVVDEYPCQVILSDSSVVWVNEFSLTCSYSVTDKAIENFKENFLRVWSADAENDPFNELILLAELDWRQVCVLRAYAKYYRQTGTSFSAHYIAKTLVSHPVIAKRLFQLFDARLNPRSIDDRLPVDTIKADIISLLDDVSVLDQDRIFRKYISMIMATLRTNFYQHDHDRSCTTIVFKLDSSNILDMPRPLPQFEIFVYAVDFEGVHLRAGKVARGGIRWSDRVQDFRVEVLGLMKAQQVKNSVIVPSGAKGGFVIKSSMEGWTRDEIYQKGVSCYERFISGLLDVVDNLHAGNVVKHTNTICYDTDDVYLVVAADKGTARFSDIANQIAIDRGFWLGDAFASGGSTGYDHMKMGITARGAWVSAERHFLDLGIDITTTPFTVIGIGDMSGDVFGNGLLMSDNAKLVCAFNHQHIFIDPDPDPKRSYKERQRLFKLPRSGWSDYNTALISKGGAIFSRSQKTIKLSPQIQKLLGLTDKVVEPSYLIKAILQSSVDMIWNGGIGTFIKSEDESHFVVGDPANDAIRVDANSVTAKMICEGGNLGVTQRGRIEYELCGGRVNTDFIDNSAGVDCSDHEVNMKILLNSVVDSGLLSIDDRNTFLADLTDDVAALVLRNNYVQNKVISFASHFQNIGFTIYMKYIDDQVAAGNLDLELAGLPSQEALIARRDSGALLTRPEISVLMSHSKIELTKALIKEIPECEFSLSSFSERAFPIAMQKQYASYIDSHRLKHEIIATQLAHHMVSDLGIAFIYHLCNELDITSLQVAKAYVAAHEIFDMAHYNHTLEQLDGEIPASDQYAAMLDQFRFLRLVVRWFLSRYSHIHNPNELVELYKPSVQRLSVVMKDLLVGEAREAYDTSYQSLCDLGVDKEIAHTLVLPRHLFQALNIVEVSLDVDCDIVDAAVVYFSVKDYFHLSILRQMVFDFSADNQWLVMSRTSCLAHLDKVEQLFTSIILRCSYSSSEEVVANKVHVWTEELSSLIGPWLSRFDEFIKLPDHYLPALLVIIEQLRQLAVTEYVKNPGKKNLLVMN